MDYRKPFFLPKLAGRVASRGGSEEFSNGLLEKKAAELEKQAERFAQKNKEQAARRCSVNPARYLRLFKEHGWDRLVEVQSRDNLLPILSTDRVNDEAMRDNIQPIDILLVEDNPGDVRLTIEALKEAKVLNTLATAPDGVEALAYLNQSGKYAQVSRPDLILLDLNLPKKDGREVLAEIKKDPVLKRIPVVILTTSKAETDIVKSYDLHANCYITKPVDLDQFMIVIKSIENFWLTVVKLPPK